MVERLSNLVGIFQKPELDFSQNRAEHDDILGDAYEYLMRHFATESGKSKGQFYTPSEVSRVIAKVIGISPENTNASTTAYDPTCGSGSLLLKVAAQAGKHITLEGRERDVTTAGLARMNMILQDIDAHLRGGIPERDLDALADYWQVLPGVRAALFSPRPSGDGPGEREGSLSRPASSKPTRRAGARTRAGPTGTIPSSPMPKSRPWWWTTNG